jgi:phage FluMu protein Com
MNSELTQRLVKRFPVLYQEYHSPMTQTCMCWGFDHGDGWFEIIWQLSLAIEEELGYSWLQKRWFLVKKGFFCWWNRVVYKQSPVQDDKRKQEGSGTKENPYRWVVVEKASRDWLARLAWKLFPPPRFDDYRSWPAKLQRLGFKAFVRWPHAGLAVVQVKEKFGTLRFYCGGTEAIDKYVRLAERLSSVTCEDCGKLGKVNDSGWIRTQCDACRTIGQRRVQWRQNSGWRQIPKVEA